MNLAFIPFLLLAVPIAEIGVFIAVGQWIGIGWTLLGILLTAILGTILLRRQGLALLGQARQEVDAGRVPAKELADGVMLLAAGILLLTPGFVTDALGFSLFLPPVRAVIRSFVDSRVQVMGAEAFRAQGFPGQRSPQHGPGVVDLDEAEFSSRPSGDSNSKSK
ncbi:MAG: FxsA family protein, partial [Pseudomonadota bacterium]